MSVQQEFFELRVLPLAGEIETWRSALVELLDTLSNATVPEWADENFLRHLWDTEAVSSTGLGHVSVDAALSDMDFQRWFAAQAIAVRQLSGQAQINALKSFCDELYVRFKALGMKSMPRLKIHRVLAALAPESMTTVANSGSRQALYRWITGKTLKNVHEIDQHVTIRREINRLASLYPQLHDVQNLTTFMLPWIVADQLAKASHQVKTKTVVDLPVVGSAASVAPKKAFIAIGGLPRLLEICAIVDAAPLSDEDMYEQLQERFPWDYPWAKSVAGFLTNNLAILELEDRTFQLSELGRKLLEARSGDVLAERLVGHFAGVDHVLNALKEGPRLRSELITLLRRMNLRLTSDFAPNTTLLWLKDLGAIVLNKGEYALTSSGEEWARLVSWTPAAAEVELLPDAAELMAVEMEVPAWRRIKSCFQSAASADKMLFPEAKIFELHAGLWSHKVRHFCILKGLSGSGKTQMAVRYARAVIEAAGEDESCLEIIPVQPDWSDPSHLLGFNHPLDAAQYQGTQFLNILLRAHNNPTKPHFVVLDELNLAHPELYLAPLLSAMETESELWLHQSSQVHAHGIPGAIRYPRNLAIIGTINIDETTHNLSDKVKDRAELIDFSDVALSNFDWSAYDGLGERLGLMRQVVTDLHAALLPVRLHFAFRVVASIADRVQFAHATLDDEADYEWRGQLDDAIASKILPKLRGEDSMQLRLAMDMVWTVLSESGLNKSAHEVDRLRRELARDGVMKYWR